MMQDQAAIHKSYLGVSVVICCHNSASRLPQTLAHLARQQMTTEAVPWEVIVIDNGSTDQTAAVARQHWPVTVSAPLRVIAEPQIGLSHARRRGFAEARYELVSFIDDDNWVSPQWVETVSALMGHRPLIGACGGWNVAVSEGPLPVWFERYQANYAVGEQGSSSGDVTMSRRYLWGAGLTIRKVAWTQLLDAGFHPLLLGRSGSALSSGEDSEICYALCFAGWRLWYDQRLQLQHYLPIHRLEWRYLRQLHHETGGAFVILGVYRQMLELPASIVDHLKQIWLWQLMSSLGSLLYQQMKWCLSRVALYYCDFSGERAMAAEKALLERDYYQGKLTILLRKRRDYARMIQEVRTLAQQFREAK